MHAGNLVTDGVYFQDEGSSLAVTTNPFSHLLTMVDKKKREQFLKEINSISFEDFNDNGYR